MIRAGEGSRLANDFESSGHVAIGWGELGDLSGLTTAEDVRRRTDQSYPHKSPAARANYSGQAHRFRNVIAIGDRVITYDGPRREYLIGTISGDYQYHPDFFPGYDHVRRVEWGGRVSRDVLRDNSKNSLGAILTVFEPGDHVLADVEDALQHPRSASPDGGAKSKEPTNFEELFAEFIEDYLVDSIGVGHRQRYLESIETGRANYDAVIRAERAGEDVTDLVLRTLLPHTDSARHREGGEWIHTAPAITKDIRSWYEGGGLAKPEDWPGKARLILDFIKRVADQPDDLKEACRDFASSPASKGLQSGILSPILNALHPDQLPVVNSKVVKTIKTLSKKRIKPTIAEYPSAVAVVTQFTTEHQEAIDRAADDELNAMQLFDLFSHWFISVREGAEVIETDGDTDDEETGGFDRMSLDDTRRAIEGICPDAAPRASALELLGHAIRVAHEASPGSWSITLYPSRLRLNAGGIAVFDLRKSGLYVVARDDVLDDRARAATTEFVVADSFRYMTEAKGYLVPYSGLDPAARLLQPASDALIELAIKKSRKAPYQASHAKGAVEYLQQLGLKVPSPAYSYSSTPTGKHQISEGQVPGPDTTTQGTNALYTLDDMAAETHIGRELLESWVRSINRKGQAIIYGPPGTGKTFTAERLAKHLVGGGDGIVELVQFHPAYAYEDFIQGLRPTTNGSGQIEFKVIPGRLLEFCARASERSGISVLIIDEINRANLSQVFGELMFLLEYRDRELALAGGRGFRLPGTVRIIGTMNTADRSIALVDHALRRRFAFLQLAPDFDVLRRFHERQGRKVEGLVAVLRELNEEIKDPHYSVGISFFMRDQLPTDMEAIWHGEIEPYLEELFFDRAALVDQFRWSRVRERISDWS